MPVTYWEDRVNSLWFVNPEQFVAYLHFLLRSLENVSKSTIRTPYIAIILTGYEILMDEIVVLNKDALRFSLLNQVLQMADPYNPLFSSTG